ncbi:MAG: hypothetical protein LQ338_001622 [Usnochroma carphineum]|nr:MAG: hypothetical protein LQ338_001622 [Usnochroma carphineum]
MVACMPACASFFRFFAAKTDFFPALKAHISLAWSSVSKLVKTPSGPRNTTGPDNQVLPTGNLTPASAGRYWRVKNVSSSEKDDFPPQITANNQSGTLRTGRLSVFGTGSEDWTAPGRANKEEDATRSSHDVEEPPPAIPHGWI